MEASGGAVGAFLEGELGRLQARLGRGHSFLLVYDGSPPPGARSRGKGLRIVYPRRGTDADRVILEEARRAEGRMEVRVVTSDRHDIGTRLRGLRVRHYEVEEFCRELWPGPQALATEDVDPEKPAPPRGGEVKRWLRWFEEGDDGSGRSDR